MTTVPVKVMRVRENTPLPKYMTSLAAGADLHAMIDRSFILRPGERRPVPTGLAFEISPGYEIQLRPRSGLAIEHGLTLINTPVIR